MRYQRLTDITQAWEFVCVATDHDDPGKSRVVLRDRSGKDVCVPFEAFQRDYKLLEGKSSPANEAVKEMLSSIRQISTTRFVALPVFLGGAAGLAKASRQSPWSEEAFVEWFGLGLSLVGVIFEIVLSRNLICWWKALASEVRTPPWTMIFAHRSDFALWPVRLALFAPYVATVWYWSQRLFTGSGQWLPAAVAVAASVWVWVKATPARNP